MLKVSVVVPAFNAERTLGICLAAIYACRDNFHECIVVDDRSEDSTATVAEGFGATVIRSDQRRGPASARNLGASRASGDILVFIDADVAIAPGALKRFANAFRQDKKLSAVIGSYDDEPTERTLVSSFKNLQHHFIHQTASREACTFWCGCGAVRRSVYLAHGGLDESYTQASIEDIEFGLRLFRAGRKLRLDPQIQGKHMKLWSFKDLVLTDVLRRGIPWMELILQQGEMPAALNLSHKQRISVVSSVLLCLTPLMALANQELAVAVAAALLSLIIVLNRAFYGFLAERRGLRFAAVAFPVHLLYFTYCALAAVAAVVRHLGGFGRKNIRRDMLPSGTGSEAFPVAAAGVDRG